MITHCFKSGLAFVVGTPIVLGRNFVKDMYLTRDSSLSYVALEGKASLSRYACAYDPGLTKRTVILLRDNNICVRVPAQRSRSSFKIPE